MRVPVGSTGLGPALPAHLSAQGYLGDIKGFYHVTFVDSAPFRSIQLIYVDSEPATFALAGIAAVALCATRRHQRHAFERTMSHA